MTESLLLLGGLTILTALLAACAWLMFGQDR